MCEKIAYDTYFEAQQYVNFAKKHPNKRIKNGKRINRMQSKLPKRVYKCEQCGKYHLTSRKKKK